MKTARVDYPFEVRPLSADEGSGYAITFPDLPGCRSDGRLPKKPLKMAAMPCAVGSLWLVSLATKFRHRSPGRAGDSFNGYHDRCTHN
jgi:hypothetical protein